MNDKMMLQNCISKCNTSMADINSMSQSVQNAKSKDELNRASQAINDCISHCQNALQNL